MGETDETLEDMEKLREEHRSLDDAITRITENPPFDDLEIQRLKRRKLHLKDRISAIENDLIPDIIA